MADAPSPRRRPGREGKQLVAGHFPRPLAKRLRRIALEEDTTVQALLGEAIEDLFAKRERVGRAGT